MEKDKKIILVNPWIHDFSAYDLWLKPLGLLYIASHLEHHGFNVQLIDSLDYNRDPKQYGCSKFHSEEIIKPCHFNNIPRRYKRYGTPPQILTEQLYAISRESAPVLIGVTSMMTYWHQGVSETIRYLKEIFVDTPVVLGGIYATLCYEHALKNSGADYVIRGPGEEAMLGIASKMIPPNPQSVIYNPQSSFPSYHLYPNLQSAAMLTSRGCPLKCSYCASPSLASGFSQYPPDKVIDEIEHYRQLGVTDIAFYDDALLVNPETHIHPILDGLINRSDAHERSAPHPQASGRGTTKTIRFHTPNGLHIKYIDKPLARKLYQANFKTIRLGFEGMEEHKASPEQLSAVIAYLKEAGFTAENIGVYVLMGLPGQDPAEVDRSIEFVHQCGAQIRISQYSPVPGSADFARLLARYPELSSEPLLHNKSVYYCHDKGNGFSEFESLKLKAKRLNAAILHG